MKIVILDGGVINPGDISWGGLEDLGEFIVYDNTGNEDNIIQSRIENADIVLTNNTPITRETMNNCSKLKYIGVLSTGYNRVDVEAAKELNIEVTNIPEYGTNSVSQFAIALLLEICHNIGRHSDLVDKGEWIKNQWSFWRYPLIELKDKTIGIYQYGKIGRQTAKIAKALGMNVLIHSRSRIVGSKDEIGEFVSFDHLLKKSDVISLHSPLTKETKGIINKNTISEMKNGVIIINVSRGGLIVEEDLAEALNNKKVFAAGLDVVGKEPMEEDNPLVNARNCYITPHIAWAAIESRQRMIDIAYENILGFLNGKAINSIF